MTVSRARAGGTHRHPLYRIRIPPSRVPVKDDGAQRSLRMRERPRNRESLESHALSTETKSSSSSAVRRSSNPQAVCLLFLLIAATCVMILGLLVNHYSLLIMASPISKRLSTLTDDQLDAIVQEHSFVMIGGPHRGGTTLLWRLLSSHQAMSGFPERTDSDFSEGVFLQSVLPTFGVGAAVPPGRSRRAPTTGLGRYAFDSEAHLTESHPLSTAANSRRLVSEWGYYWNLSRPVLLEKTPTNMLTSRLLQALFTPAASSASNVERPLQVPSAGIRFLFISRHPLAVSLAHRKWPECAGMSIPSLLAHWLASHRTLASDLPHLRSARVLRFEDLARAPRECVQVLLEWLELPQQLQEQAFSNVADDTNHKYERDYCEQHLSSAAHRRSHCAVANALQPTIDMLGLGYDIRHGNHLGFACIRDSLGQDVSGCKDEAIGVAAGLIELMPPADGKPMADGLSLPLEQRESLSMASSLSCTNRS